jgi:cephalosporin hydroxylase
VLFMASILELIGKGKVIGVDIDIRAHNRDSIERHPIAKRVILVEGPIPHYSRKFEQRSRRQLRYAS